MGNGSRWEFSAKSLLADQLGIEFGGLRGNGGPTEFLFSAFAPRFSHLFAQCRIDHEFIDSGGEIAGEFGGSERFEGTFSHLLQRDEITGLPMDDDLLDSAHGAGYDRGLAGHGFQVNDAKRLVNRRTAKDSRVGVQLIDGRLVDHLLNPDHAGSLGGIDSGLHLGGDGWCIWSSGTEDHLEIRIHVFDGVDKMDDPLLPRDTSNKQNKRHFWIDAITNQRVRDRHLPVFVEIDAVVDRVKPIVGHIKEPLYVGPGFAGYRHDRISHLNGGFFKPACEIVTTPKLLPLPRPERFQGMNGEHHGNAVVEFRKNTGPVSIPSMTVNKVGIDVRRIEIRASLNRPEYGVQGLGTRIAAGVEPEPKDAQMIECRILIPKCAHLDIHQFGEFATEVIDMNAGTAIDVGGVFVAKKKRFHDVFFQNGFGLRNRAWKRTGAWTSVRPSGPAVPLPDYKLETIPGSSNMDYESLQDLYIHTLKDLYSAEKQILRALPKIAKHASSPHLRDALEKHREETRMQAERLEQILERHGKGTRGARCKGMEGILEEGEDWLAEDASPDVMDAGIISQAQHVEHYEIAGYGAVRTFANMLGFVEDETLLSETLQEEGNADKKLTALSEKINVLAKQHEAAQT